MPPILPVAPRPVPGELRTAWLRRVAAANVVSFAELLDAFAMVLPARVPAHVWLDDTLPPSVCARLAAWCRLVPSDLAALDISRMYPLAAVDTWTHDVDATWHAGPLALEPSLRLAFCPSCLREQRHRGDPLHLRAEWALAWLTHCPRHGTWLLNACVRCMRPNAFDFEAAHQAIVACRFCGTSLDVPLPVSACSPFADVFRLQTTLLACAQGHAVDLVWAGPCQARSFLGLIRDLVTLVASRDAHGTAVLADYLPERVWSYPRLRIRDHQRWAMLSSIERLILLSAVIALLRGPRLPAEGIRTEDPLQRLWRVLSSSQRDTLRRRASRWPRSIRRRLVNAIGRVA